MRIHPTAIVEAGAFVQLDCPDLAMGRHTTYAGMDLDDYRKRVAMNIEALNQEVDQAASNLEPFCRDGETFDAAAERILNDDQASHGVA